MKKTLKKYKGDEKDEQEEPEDEKGQEDQEEINNQYGNYMGLHINQNLYYYPQIPMMGYNLSTIFF